MRLLVDTHVLLWALAEPARLGPKARKLLEDPANEVLFSAASIWEIAIKARLGHADFPFQPNHIAQESLALGFIELPVAWAAAARVADLPFHHRDPFDRILVAQALTEPVALLTVDRKLLGYSDLVQLADRA